MNYKYPHITFINTNFSYYNNTSITVSKLTDHFPKDKIVLLSDKASLAVKEILELIKIQTKLN